MQTVPLFSIVMYFAEQEELRDWSLRYNAVCSSGHHQIQRRLGDQTIQDSHQKMLEYMLSTEYGALLATKTKQGWMFYNTVPW